MWMDRRLWTVWGLALAAAGGLLALALLPARPTSAQAPQLVISEIAWGGTPASTADEWMELYNPTGQPVDLTGWTLNAAGSTLHVDLAGVVAPDGYFLLERTDDQTISDIPADQIYTGALANGGDSLELRDGNGVLIDTANADGGGWPAGTPGPGFYSMERSDPLAPDTDGNWHSNDGVVRNGHDANNDPINGTPRQPNSPVSGPTATPTDIPTATPTPATGPSPTATATATRTWTPTGGPSPTSYAQAISLNEFMPDPSFDWNGNGQTGDADDEYIEVYNASNFQVDISGWMLDDVNGGTTPYTLPPDTKVPAHGFLVFFSNQTGIGLNNGGDTVRLLWPDGTEQESYIYSASATDQAYSKAVDGGTEWTRDYPPSPGTSNQPPTPTPTGTPSATRTPTPTPTASQTPTAGPTPTDTPTSTASPTPTSYAPGVSLNEYLPDPASDWDGDGTANAEDEYIELYNANSFAVDLSGWLLDDVEDPASSPLGSDPYPLPPGTVIEAHGFLVFYRSGTGVALNNDGDWVRLLHPDGSLVEATEYSTSRDDEAYSKTVDGGTEWTRDYPPSPGTSNQPPANATPTPTATPGPGTTAALAGWVFDDVDGDGVYEPWNGEAGIAGVLVTLSDGRSKLTGPTGWYGWANLAPGDYTVREAQPLHTSSTTPDELTVTLAAGDNRDDLNFGEVLLPPGQVQSPVVLNEFLPSPASDWDGDGTADAEDEWIELFNSGDRPLDLGGWFLDDEAEPLAGGSRLVPTGSQPYLIPPGTVIQPQGFLVIYRSTSGVALNNSGDDVRLLGPGRYELESFAFGSTGYDVSWSKTVDGGGQWTDAYLPSPGGANLPPGTPVSTVTATPTATPAGTPTPYATGVGLNEYLPDPASDWDGDGQITAEDEYVELYNAAAVPVDLGGWLLDDVDDGATARGRARPQGSQPYVIPAGTTIPAGGFLVLFRSETGVALNNDGDWVRLLHPDGSPVEATQYATSHDDQAFSKTVDGGDQWTTAYPPSPGASNIPGATPTATVTPTATATATPTPTATPGTYPPGVGLNEFMPDPASDWNGDGTPDQGDEYIELHNAGPEPVNLGGWRLDDMDDGLGLRRLFAPQGSQPYVIPANTVIPAGGFLVFFRAETGLALNNDGDWVRLLRPDGSLVEAFEYATSRDDEAYSKLVDGGQEWTRSYPPSPGSSNTPHGTPTPSATPSSTGTPTPTATPAGTPTPFSTAVMLNEFLPRPASDWNGDGDTSPDDEYVELYNADGAAVDLSGWVLDDAEGGSQPFLIPDSTHIPAHGFLVFFRSQTGLALNDSGGDTVRLLWPDGSPVERYDYATAQPDQAYSKTTDGGGEWTASYPPSPGGSNQPGFTPDDVIRLNEILASPRNVDWDGDGQADYLDEWVELVNAGQTTVDLDGWQLVDSPPQAGNQGSYEFPGGTILAPGEFLPVFRRDSGLALASTDEWVRLLYPDDSQADAFHSERFSGYDQAWCRLPDGTGNWTLRCRETPGTANQASAGGGGSGGGGAADEPPYDRFSHNLVTVAQARGLPDDTRVTLEGQVTVLPGVLDERQIYLQDSTGGMLVYLRSAEWPPLSEGQWLRVNGPMDTFNSEREVRLTRIDDVKMLGPGLPTSPLPIRSGDVGEGHEGRLIQLSAPISGFFGSTTLYLDDGSGEAKVTIREATGIRRPYVNLGDVWTVIGVVSQWDEEAPFDDGYRILPRRPSDLQKGQVEVRAAQGQSQLQAISFNAAPLYLPVTGAAAPRGARPAGDGWSWIALAAAGLLLVAGLWLRFRAA